MASYYIDLPVVALSDLSRIQRECRNDSDSRLTVSAGWAAQAGSGRHLLGVTYNETVDFTLTVSCVFSFQFRLCILTSRQSEISVFNC